MLLDAMAIKHFTFHLFLKNREKIDVMRNCLVNVSSYKIVVRVKSKIPMIWGEATLLLYVEVRTAFGATNKWMTETAHK